MGLKIIDCFEVMAICGQGKWSSTEWRSPVKIWGPWFNHDCEPWSLLLFPLFQVRVVRFYRNCFDSIFFFFSSFFFFFFLILFFLVLLAGPQLPAHDRSGQRRTFTANRSGQCWTSTAESWSVWAVLDLNCQKESKNVCQRECRNLCQIAGISKLNVIWELMPDRMPKLLNLCREECQNLCQRERQTICQIDRQNIYAR